MEQLTALHVLTEVSMTLATDSLCGPSDIASRHSIRRRPTEPDIPPWPDHDEIRDADARPVTGDGQPPGWLRSARTATATPPASMFRDTFNPYKPSVIEWPKLERRDAAPADQPADLGHRSSDRGQGPRPHAGVWRDGARPGAGARRSPERLGGRPPPRGSVEPGHKLRHPAGPRTARPTAARSGMGLPRHRLLANASTASSPSACSSLPAAPASSRRRWSTRSSR